MLIKALSPNRSRNCSRYRLSVSPRSTFAPSDSYVPGGWDVVIFVPVQPMHQFIVPGAASTFTCGVVRFHATLQPVVQPCPEPAVVRLLYSMPVLPFMSPPSVSTPVVQR